MIVQEISSITALVWDKHIQCMEWKTKTRLLFSPYSTTPESLQVHPHMFAGWYPILREIPTSHGNWASLHPAPCASHPTNAPCEHWAQPGPVAVPRCIPLLLQPGCILHKSTPLVRTQCEQKHAFENHPGYRGKLDKLHLVNKQMVNKVCLQRSRSSSRWEMLLWHSQADA